MEDSEFIKKRFSELINRADQGGYNTYSDFLGLEELSVLASVKNQKLVHTFGGYENAQRVVAGFGENQPLNESYPIKCVKIQSKSQKYAEKLSHRDYLGTLMGLGIARSMLGDILIDWENKTAYLFCLKKSADFICDNVDRVRHTSVICDITADLPKNMANNFENKQVIVASLRADVVVSAIYNLSRGNSDKLFAEQRVFVNGKTTERSYTLSNDDVVTVRGFGRFYYRGDVSKTKKGRIVTSVDICK